MIPTKEDFEKLEFLMYNKSLDELVDLNLIVKEKVLSLLQSKKLIIMSK